MSEAKEVTEATEMLTEGAGKIFEGVSTFVEFINGIDETEKTEQFRKSVLDSLKKIESELQSIDNKLLSIITELRKIEKLLVGDKINPALTQINNWVIAIERLYADDHEGCVNLANDMITSEELSNHMAELHNALTGANDYGGLPLIESMSLEGILMMRANLNQGIRLLFFMCAFNTKRKVDFGDYLWTWSKRFRTQLKMILEHKRFRLFQPEAWTGFPIYVADTLAIYEYGQPIVEGVSLYIDIAGKPKHMHSGTLEVRKDTIKDNNYNSIREPYQKKVRFSDTNSSSYPIGNDGQKGMHLFVDLISGEHTTDPNSVLAKQYSSSPPFDRWLKVLLTLGPYGEHPNALANRGMLCSDARENPKKTFLGAAAGQMAWVDEQTPYVGFIFDVTKATSIDLDADPEKLDNDITILILGDDKKTVERKPLSQMLKSNTFSNTFNMINGLWKVSWSLVKNRILIEPLSLSKNSEPIYLNKNSQGWFLNEEKPLLMLHTYHDPPVGEKMGNPFKMKPSTVGMDYYTLKDGIETVENAKVIFHKW